MVWRAGLTCMTAAWLVAAPPRVASHPGSRSTEYFARGLDLASGSDFAFELGGVPLNLPGHVRGPGFLDGALAIPELLEPPAYLKGPYLAAEGPFALAGAARRDLVQRLDAPFVGLTVGPQDSDRFARLVYAGQNAARDLVFGLEARRDSREWRDQGSRRFNGALRRDGRNAWGAWTLTLLASEDRSDGGAARPARPGDPALPTVEDVKAGDGARSRRLLGAWRLRTPGGGRYRVFGGAQDTRLWANWTFFLRDPVWGDQREQVDRRMFLGVDAARDWTGGRGNTRWVHTLGGDLRVDRVAAVEVHPTVVRARVEGGPAPAFAARGLLYHGALHAQSTVRWGGGWEAFAGVRLDGQANRPGSARGPWAPRSTSSVLASPRAGLAFSPAEGTVLRLQGGLGVRSMDPWRDGVAQARARSVEASVQTRPVRAWTVVLTAYRLDLDRENLFDPAAVAWTARGASRHEGFELRNDVKAGPWTLEALWGWDRARFRADGARVPGAPAQAGLVSAGWSRRGFSAGAAFRRAGARPLLPDDSLRAGREDAVEARVQQVFGPWTVGVQVANAFGRKAYNQQFAYVSRLPLEPAGGVLGRCVKPADPQQWRLEIRRRF
ncbi:TonB-dependent receptor domain-containing protein [Mesoterricola sediminis]|uniref:TonB-dependent receptor n=1 Tax=Mesoterricola sediminis TaxID=2927980 RepID=A0AA48KB37_9BACT|nr:TonB-dependent receptor [Mesoterricola sediminis]BDU75709.1 TonB-dependent receptor [Mesoterricola sediminis]